MPKITFLNLGEVLDTWRAGNDWAACCGTTTDKRPDLPVQK
jgi:hypothetical protein